MSRLPVIVGFGGYNAAGRSSFHHAFRRTVLESLDEQARQQTLAGLAVMMKLVKFEDGHYLDAADGARLDLAAIERRHAAQILGSTLIRRIEKQYFDVDAAHWHKNLTLEADGAQPLSFTTARKQLPEPLPANWSVEELADNQVRVTLHDSVEVKVDSYREMPVKSAGQLPTGFEPGELYASRFHPRGLQMAVVGATDAIRSVGIDWQRIVDRVQPDEIAVFSSSIMSQLDDNGFGGLLQSRLKGHRVSAKQLPLGFNSMPTDFINAYVLGSVGLTGSVTGACATFLYNLQKGIEAITSGQARVVVVGNSEAPITSEIVEGYAAMSALATEEGLRNIEGRPDVDFRRASRPFGENCGFTLAESSQYVVLMDDALALELGADIHGAVTDVFINADGFKKSISAPGPGNYLTMAKAVAAAMQIVGEEGVRRHSFVHAHGSSTPANRVTESEILDRVAKAFGIADWPVAAVKAFVGHSLATASADQLVSALGTFKYGLLPGIKTVETFADDVHKDRIALSNKDRRRDDLDVCFINSKGFGGNNATGVLLSPRLAEKMLRKRHGAAAFDAYQARREQTRAAAQRYEEQALKGQFDIIYNFGNDMIDDRDIRISAEEMSVPGFAQPLVYKKDERFSDMLD
ncbi:beta-ketoacyl synthase [Pseudomonas sp. R3.Fl]|uniref:beta-ketoacyl synthase n=1 Tax=Pseudomonas TaxID=286 RepID=UPI00201D86B0|nr:MULTISPECIES: beta-ketoacyl synthase [Pseudomonas]MCL6690554.1 beta-ketoacyl synthase [Pseudomonas sp. R3.Fl]MCP1606797.1 acetoacetyl-[acyl-carrier protein] synthase [Pseudomonas citronellolis]MCP1657589.1 acetoacetyl-[acyl-carrier protein] synthase [Pseudomonas citronellolis]MCP1724510.1 acetoacetyl-[acyl-carrier protein] synthase [Pseudomonas citronellolis]MDN6874688.1 beta-ketoacyl synthase [Pseudomonas citronellolis]